MTRTGDDPGGSQPPRLERSLSIPQLLKFDETFQGLQHDLGANAPEVVTHTDGADGPRVGSCPKRDVSKVAK